KDDGKSRNDTRRDHRQHRPMFGIERNLARGGERVRWNVEQSREDGVGGNDVSSNTLEPPRTSAFETIEDQVMVALQREREQLRGCGVASSRPVTITV